jgi:adenosylcobinamide kinase / adenosylcobinamide-phosphate guanylyltransferase
MGRLILVLGGARSGKSTYAQRLAQAIGRERVLFVATAEAGDAEMAQRITKHRQERPAAWRTVEAPRQVGAAVCTYLGEARVVLVDCLTLLVSNIIVPVDVTADLTTATTAVKTEVDALLQVCRSGDVTCIVVSNEVGLGLVPDTPLGRVYRDLLGHANQVLAAHAQAVYFMVAGLAVEVKALAQPQEAGGISTPWLPE